MKKAAVAWIAGLVGGGVGALVVLLIVGPAGDGSAPIGSDPVGARYAGAEELEALRADVAALTERWNASEKRGADAGPELAGRASPTPSAAPAGDVESAVRKALPADTSEQRLAEAVRRAREIEAGAEMQKRMAAARAAQEAQKAIEAEKRFMDDKARGGTMAMLRALKDEKVHAFELVASPAEFGRHFERQVKGPTLTDDSWNSAAAIEDGSTIHLGSGVHRWDAAAYQHAKEFPKDLLFEGAGMDETLLILNELSSREEIKSLTFKDLTIDCNNHYFTDLRRDEPVTISMQNCRVVGFDMGAGGSVMLKARTAAFYARDCRFEAGFSRRDPGSGNLFRVRSGLLVRIENSTFVGPFRSVYDSNKAATYLFTGCTFEQMADHQKNSFEKPGAGVRFEQCSFSFLPARAEGVEPPKKRSLKDINSNWR